MNERRERNDEATRREYEQEAYGPSAECNDMDGQLEFEDEVYSYLNDLRDSGVTNMFGATPYLMEEFGMNEKDSKAMLIAWMKQF